MKIKIIYQVPSFYYEAECSGETERKEAVKGLMYTLKDLDEHFNPQNYQEQPAQQPQYQDQNQYQQPQVEYATQKQKDTMRKFGIIFTNETTKQEAIKLISDYRIARGWDKDFSN